MLQLVMKEKEGAETSIQNFHWQFSWHLLSELKENDKFTTVAWGAHLSPAGCVSNSGSPHEEHFQK